MGIPNLQPPAPTSRSGDDVNFEQEVLVRECADADEGARWSRTRSEDTLANLPVGCELRHVSEVAGELHDVRKRGAPSLQSRLDVSEDLLGLGAHISAARKSTIRIARNLARDVKGSSRGNLHDV